MPVVKTEVQGTQAGLWVDQASRDEITDATANPFIRDRVLSLNGNFECKG